MKMKALMTAGATWLALLGTAAHAQAVTAAAKPCVTTSEIRAGLLTLLPGVLSAVRDACLPKLDDDSFFANGGEAMVAYYNVAGETAAPVAIAAIQRLSSESDDFNIPEEFDPAMVSVLVGSLLGPILAKELDAGTCGYADRALEQLAPLPPENLTGFVAIVAEGALAAKRKKAEAAAAEAAQALAEAETPDEIAAAEALVEAAKNDTIPFEICSSELVSR
ncbi:hypothetical protein [Stakelama tenebrarum]|uniref:Uncharacterized protein n=1 Tax=Stakelama tenebrarum TaxID=2711215 RepID=A0A6G6Y6V0_9SPHN|nr:hypothetical protein [Sphingosinithalassobacter tenebrarum]QIG80306.1 hypothetical protein G5C33_11310 [Sphingosinithalassobacter tenebrarum]